MALSRVCWARAALWGSAVTPGPHVTRKLQLVRCGLAWGAPRSSKLHLSPKADVKSLISYVVAKTKVINGKYHRFLGRHFPRFYVLYTVFMKGLQMIWADAKKARRIKTNMWKHNIKFHQLPYREMEHLRQVWARGRDQKSMVRYLFPRQLLIQHFWTPKQQIDFLDIYHALRKQSHPEILCYLEKVIPLVSDAGLRGHMTELCTKVFLQLTLPANSDSCEKLGKRARQDLPNLYQSLTSPKIQHGTHPAIHDILALRECFSNHPLGMKQLHALQMVSTLWLSVSRSLTLPQVLRVVITMLTFSSRVDVLQKALSRAMLLTPYLPSFLLRHRLRTHTTVIHQLDKALAKLGIGQLSPQEVKSACYLRGLNSTHIAEERCRTWLGEWLQISCSLKACEYQGRPTNLLGAKKCFQSSSSYQKNPKGD
ncbi:hypothetical protein GH733_006355 [Mirounga leonina]|nr:hypothetical protein GH733_006355 [Mirounga leonina]